MSNGCLTQSKIIKLKHQTVWWLVHNLLKVSLLLLLIFSMLFPLEIVWGKNKSPNTSGSFISHPDQPQEAYLVFCPLILKMLPVLPSTIRLTLIGDSITQGFNDIHPLWWEYLVTLLTDEGHIVVINNHAVSGQRIMSDIGFTGIGSCSG